MSNSTSSKLQSPRFQPLNEEKSFKQRFAGERPKNSRENPPHFGQKASQKNSSRKERAGFANEKQLVKSSKIEQLDLAKANGDGKVKVVVKSTGLAEKPREKKTGALSPRAPEKIKKNRAEEMKVYGENACLSLFAERPESIVRVWATVNMSHKIGDIFSYLAANKKVYHVVDNQELNLVSGSEHHGGICMLVKKSRPFTLTGYLDIPRQQDCIVLLDKVNNSHNIGGILRTCAAFGVKGLVTDNPELIYSGATFRVAEGAGEYVRLLQTENLAEGLTQLRQAGYQIVHIGSNKQSQSIHKANFSAKVVFVLTESEQSSLIEPTDLVLNFSLLNPLKVGLNVAVQAGILLAKYQG